MLVKEKLSNEIQINIYLREKDFIKTTDFPFQYYIEHIDRQLSDENENNDITIRFIPCRTNENTIEVTLYVFENRKDYLNDSNLDQVLKDALDTYFIEKQIPIMKYILTQSSSPSLIYTF